MTLSHDVQVKNADAAFLKATDLNQPTLVVAEPAPEPVLEAPATTATAPAAALGNLPAPGTRFRIKRWTQLTGSMAGQAHRQLLAAMISGDRGLDELAERTQARARRDPARAAGLARQRRAGRDGSTGSC